MIRAPFVISARALQQIDWIRHQYLAAFPEDPPVMCGVTLSSTIHDDGSFGPKSVAIGFWQRSGFPEAARKNVQRVSGIDLLFPIPPDDLAAFIGKEIDYSPDRAFFLHDAPPA